STGRKRHLLPFWTYRRLIDKTLFKSGTYKSDVSMINWDSNDLRGKNIIDKSPAVQKKYLSLAKRVSLGFLYWLQTTAPRDDSTAIGYPELKLRYDVLGTRDGLSKYPYIREARRLAARLVVVAQDIVETDNPEARATLFPDSCGIGLYPVDIHGHQEIPGAAQQTKPFQVPLAALVSDYCPNYIAGCKNIGVTHITNGAYRLHPIEWAIGTAAGALASLAHRVKITPLSVVDQFYKTLLLQIALAESGAPIFWFDDLKADHPAFAAAHVLAGSGMLPVDPDSLSFRPEENVSAGEMAALTKNLSERMPQPNIWETAIPVLIEKTGGKRGEFVRAVLEKVKLSLKSEAIPVPEPMRQW
ncbi:MAG: FAD-dependent oxidoreductase, partial [Cyanobacteria bacterium REEB67]|nr:FAD-dependent oxidoreductase [Cyanobacteria bacterium REEB67]